jgi:hypothetical protein
MIILGFLLIVAAVVAAVILIIQNTGSIDIHALGHVWSANAYWLIVAGIVAMALAALGVAMVRASARPTVVTSDVPTSDPNAVTVQPRHHFRTRSS